jgi:hypothetical protein
MTTNMHQVDEALVAALRACLSRAGEFTISPVPMSGSPLPRIEVWPGVDGPLISYYDESDSDDGVASMRRRILIETSTDPRTGYKVLTELLEKHGPSSIREQLHADRTLGGVVDSLTVQNPDYDESGLADGVHRAWVPVLIFVTL